MEPDKQLTKPDLYVLARNLERLWEEKRPILRTRLQVAVGLNYDIFMRYVDWMLKKGFIAYVQCSDERDGIVLTEAGSAAYRSLIGWINEYISQGRRK